MTTPKLLLFDLGNVLVHIRPERFALSLGLDPEEVKLRFGDVLKELIVRYESGKCSTDEYFGSINSLLDHPVPIGQMREAFLTIIADPIPGMEELVRTVSRRMPTALVSNTNECHFSDADSRLPALKYLSKRYLSYQVGFIKPMPGFYEYILRHETVPPGDMLFIDDIAENIGAAQQAGMQGHIFQSAVELRRLLSNLKTL